MKHRTLLFSGTGTALVTPFRNDGAVDEVVLRELVIRQVKGGVDALVPVGTTGEAVTLSDAEQARVIEITVEAVNGKVPVIAGASSNATTKAIALAREAKRRGADAILTVAPFYNKPTQEGLYQHFGEIAEAVEMPVVLYNVPGRTGVNIDAATTLRLANDIPFIAGVKEASGNLPQIMEVIRHRPKNFGVWSGDDNLTLPLAAAGGDGIISVIANEFPAEFSQMVRYALKGKYAKARDLHYRLLPLMNANFIESNPIPVKTVMAMQGLLEENFRLPMTRIGDASRAKLQAILNDLTRGR
jgi:4-hydroxy-tetrahydrodipicolinate synthase